MTNTVDNILKSYSDVGIINPVEGTHLPTKKRISDSLDHIKEILFPGFFGNDLLKQKELADLTKERVASLESVLLEELPKCIVWNPEDPESVSSKEAVEKAADITDDFLNYIPSLRSSLKEDATSMYEGDPAAKSIIEVILCYPGFQAVMDYRIAHFFYKKNVPIIPRIMTEIAHLQTGIDIHPGATIGNRFCIDHGTGIVIGETAVIGQNVKLYQGVTLGAFSVKKGESETKRHPTLEDNVTVYAMSTILGGNTTVGEGAVVGGNVWLTRSIPAHSKIYLDEDFDKTYTLIQKT